MVFIIVLDVNSGAVHVVDQLSYELLDGLELLYRPTAHRKLPSDYRVHTAMQKFKSLRRAL